MPLRWQTHGGSGKCQGHSEVWWYLQLAKFGSQPVFEYNDLGYDVLDEVRRIWCIKPQQARAHRFRKLFDFGFFVGHVHLRPATHSTLSTTAQSTRLEVKVLAADSDAWKLPNTYAGWWFQPLLKILVNWGDYSKYAENKNCSKPPTSNVTYCRGRRQWSRHLCWLSGGCLHHGDIGQEGRIKAQKNRVCEEGAARHFEIGYVRYWFIILSP